MDPNRNAPAPLELVGPPLRTMPAIRIPLSAWEDRFFAVRAIEDRTLRLRDMTALCEAILECLRELRAQSTKEAVDD